MICPKCKSKVPDDSMFCQICGCNMKGYTNPMSANEGAFSALGDLGEDTIVRPVQPTPPPPPKGKVPCPHCARMVTPGSAFCEYCGHKLSTDRKTTSIKWKPILAIAALCLVVVLLITMFAGSGNALSGTYTSESGAYAVDFKKNGTCTWLQGGYTFNGTYEPLDGGWQLNMLGGGIAYDTVFFAEKSGKDLVITGGIVYGEVFTKNSSKNSVNNSVNNNVISSGNSGIAGSKDSSSSSKHERGNYYSIKEAKSVIANKGYRVGKEIDSVSDDGYFSCQMEIKPEKYKFLSISGYIDFTAIYDEEAGWLTEIKPEIIYDWHVSGSWYAETEKYYVYMDVIECDGYTLQANIRAEYDSTEGGRGSYGPYTIVKELRLVTDDFRQSGEISDAWAVCEMSCGALVFNFRLTKDSMFISQLTDSYTAEFVPN